MDGRFLTAFVLPKQWDIIGYKLKPYSLRHSLYLLALQNPFVTGNMSSLTPEDILVFLRICSAEHPAEALRNPTIRDRWRAAWMQSSIEYYFAVIKEITTYIHECCSSPVFYRKEELDDGKLQNKKKENIPHALTLAVTLMSKLGMSEQEAWDTPMGKAIWYISAYSVSEGADIKILSTEDEQKADFERNFLVNLQAELAKAKQEKKQNG